jgi:hypothetical protein
VRSAVEQTKCEERDRLQDDYGDAVSLWMQAGGSERRRMSSPAALAAKKDLDHIAELLIDHRDEHGC